MSDEEHAIDIISAQGSDPVDRQLTVDERRALHDYLVSAPFELDREEQDWADYASPLYRWRAKALLTQELSARGQRLSERAVIGGSIGVAILGMSTVFDQSVPFYAFALLVLAGYGAFRGMTVGRKQAAAIALCGACIHIFDEKLKGRKHDGN